jgi:hypothetical protein
LNSNPVNPALEGDECGCDKNKHHDQDNTLFVLGELENPEQAFHFLA